MSDDVLFWDIYEISSQTTALNGVMLRGRIRKLGIQKKFNVLAENTEDAVNMVRFAVLRTQHKELIEEYLKGVMSDVCIDLVRSHCPNPVLSKLKVNDETRYSL